MLATESTDPLILFLFPHHDKSELTDDTNYMYMPGDNQSV